eukprot:2565181-Rhodomonas_salina.1
MEALEQIYICGVRLRGESIAVASLLQGHNLFHAHLSSVSASPLVYRIEDNCDWIVEATLMRQSNDLLDMVDGLTGHEVLAVQILEKVWKAETDRDRLACIESFIQRLSFARKSRCQTCHSSLRFPVSGSLSGGSWTRVFCGGCMHYTTLECSDQDYTDTAFMDHVFGY